MSRPRFLTDSYRDRTATEVRDFYDRWSEVYDEELSEAAYAQPSRCAAALSAMTPDRSQPAIDIGCGTGLSGLALREAGYTKIDGCDLSPGMLEKAARTEIYNRLFETDLNVPPLDVPDGHYAAIAAVGVFSFGHVMADAIDEFLRIGRPGAAIVIGMNDKYYREGSVPKKLDALEAAGLIVERRDEHGDHLPGIGLSGWVITFRKSGQEG